ncbi:MAG: 2-oxo acid dehydrogenase subunit E2 [Thermodesulfobacteriota bacterium]
MTIEYKLPDLGEDIETGDVIGVFVSAGDKVSEEQALLEVETDKAAIEIPAPSGGVIKEVHVNEGDTIKVGQLLVTIDDGKTNGKDEPIKEDAKIKTQDEAIEEIAEREVEEEINADPEPEPEIEIEAAPEDTEDEIQEVKINEPDDERKTEHTSSPASPSTRRLARELGVDISLINGSGPGGRILEEDVRNFTPEAKAKPKEKQKEIKVEKPKPQKKSSELKADKWGDVERTPMSKVRKLTAERLTQAWDAPHVTQFDKADITDLEKLRKEFGQSVAKSGGKLTTTSILVKIIASALKTFPQFNASVDMENGEIIYKHYYNIGIAVDTDRGLLVPVIKNADEKNITQLSVELSELSEKARTKKISVDELQGGTFTISNLGGLGGTYFTPVVNAPEVAILGISRSRVEPVYRDGGFLPRLMLPLSLSYDHRLVDGADAVRFLRWIVEALEEPFKLPLEG